MYNRLKMLIHYPNTRVLEIWYFVFMTKKLAYKK